MAAQIRHVRTVSMHHVYKTISVPKEKVDNTECLIERDGLSAMRSLRLHSLYCFVVVGHAVC